MLLVRCFLLQLVHQNEDPFPRYLWTNAHFYSNCFVTIPGLLEATLEQQEETILQKQQARPPSWLCSPSPNRLLAPYVCCTGRGLSRCCTWAMVAPHALKMPRWGACRQQALKAVQCVFQSRCMVQVALKQPLLMLPPLQSTLMGEEVLLFYYWERKDREEEVSTRFLSGVMPETVLIKTYSEHCDFNIFL